MRVLRKMKKEKRKLEKNTGKGKGKKEKEEEERPRDAMFYAGSITFGIRDHLLFALTGAPRF